MWKTVIYFAARFRSNPEAVLYWFCDSATKSVLLRLQRTVTALFYEMFLPNLSATLNSNQQTF